MKKKKQKIFNLNLALIIISICLLISIILNIYIYNNKSNNYIVDENIVFFGDSITNKYKVEEFFPNNHVINSGISGDGSEDLLKRMDDVYKYNPSKVFLLIGINDLNHDIKENKNEILKVLEKIDTPIYITVDIDVLDPAYAPSVGTPAPCGITPYDLEDMIGVLSKKNVVGIDVVEVSSNTIGDTTSINAAKVIYDFLSLQD